MNKNNKQLQKEIEDTKVKIKKLREQNSRLKDEVRSLWGLFDELQAADIKNWGHLMKELEKKDTISDMNQLMATAKKADC